MVENEIKILKEQIEKLDVKGFDLEAWKINSINILDRIFGSNSIKIEQLKELKYDFSSWNLRDTSGSAGSIKKKAKVILESAIYELESFGLPKIEETNLQVNESIISVFEEELKGSQFKKLKEIFKLNDLLEKKKAISELFDEMSNEAKQNIIANIIMKME